HAEAFRSIEMFRIDLHPLFAGLLNLHEGIFDLGIFGISEDAKITGHRFGGFGLFADFANDVRKTLQSRLEVAILESAQAKPSQGMPTDCSLTFGSQCSEFAGGF